MLRSDEKNVRKNFRILDHIPVRPRRNDEPTKMRLKWVCNIYPEFTKLSGIGVVHQNIHTVLFQLNNASQKISLLSQRITADTMGVR
jgi:hypothetical protein